MEQGGRTRPRTRERVFFRVFRLPPATWLPRLRWRGEDLRRRLAEVLEAELAERAGFQWLAVAFGIGAIVYFELPREPMLAALLGAALLLAGLASVTYQRGAPARFLILFAVFAAGMSVAKVRVDRLDGPEITRPVAASFSGRVVVRDDRAELTPRIVLDRLATKASWVHDLPGRIRVTVGERYGLPPIGARIAFHARLMPVPGPIVPGGYDPHRAAYFEGIGGSGFLLGGWKMVKKPAFSLDLAVAKIRTAIVARIMAAEPGEAGAVAAALLVGERSGISEATKEDLRLSGLAHLLAISGLHMMLVAGTVFYLVRALLALSPGLALARPIRKWAAAAALLTATVYLALSGGNVATIRAYVMAAVIFSAILLDRPAISMRNLAVAAFIVIALQPESVLEPGFQMSFGAVAALIAVWEAWRARVIRRLSDDSVVPGQRLLRSAGRMVVGVAVTTLVAGAATAPFAAYHFERVASYSLLGNLLAAPLVSFIIMPFGLLSLVAMPFGLEAPLLAVMARGIDALLAIAAWVAALPGSELKAPPIAPLALAVIVVGMLWLCLWRRRWRLFGLPLIGIGLGLVPLTIDRADVLVAPDGKAVAVRDASGALRVSGGRAGSYAIGQFFDKEPGAPPSGAALRKGVRCDPAGCLVYARWSVRVAHVLDAAAFPEDCRRAAIVVTPLPAPADCRAPLVVGADALRRFGATLVHIRKGEGAPVFDVTRARSATPRPWQAGATRE